MRLLPTFEDLVRCWPSEFAKLEQENPDKYKAIRAIDAARKVDARITPEIIHSVMKEAGITNHPVGEPRETYSS